MTKKDYILVATAIKMTNKYCENLPPEQLTAIDYYLRLLLDQLAREFGNDNPKFDLKKFEAFIGKIF
jgi:hypothetical protein